jgi:hypothetical protein
LTSLLTLNQRVLDASRALVVTSRLLQRRAAPHLGERSLVHLPLAFLGLEPSFEAVRTERRLASGPPAVLFLRARDEPPWGADSVVLESLRRAVPDANLTEVEEDARHLSASLATADVVVALQAPPRAGLGEGIPRALALGRATLVSAGSGAGGEVPEGVVVHVTPGSSEAAETAHFVRRLLEDEGLRARLGERARAFAAERGDPSPAARTLHDLLLEAALRMNEPVSVSGFQEDEGSLSFRAIQEIVVAGRELGLREPPPEVVPLVDELFPGGET